MKREVWGVLTPITGLAVWVVLFWIPLQIEWTATDAQDLTIALYLAPIVPLVVGAFMRWAPLLLFVFPTSLIPGYLLLPEIDQRVYASGGGWLTIAVAFALYLLTATLWSDTRRPTRRAGDPIPSPLDDAPPAALVDGRATPHNVEGPPDLYRDLWRPYRVHFLPRLVLLLALLLVPLYGLNFADGVADRYVAGFEDQALQAQVMANLLFFFVWLVIAYLFFISPGLNLELEQRELDRSLKALDKKVHRQPRPWVIVGAAGGAVALMILLVVLRLG